MYNETELKIKKRLEELEKLRQETIEKLKIQQELVMKPIEAVIAELTALLPPEEKP